MTTAINPKWQRYYDFLDDLRESGITNMIGAGPYLVSEFDVTTNESHEILSAWMREFSA